MLLVIMIMKMVKITLEKKMKFNLTLNLFKSILIRVQAINLKIYLFKDRIILFII